MDRVRYDLSENEFREVVREKGYNCLEEMHRIMGYPAILEFMKTYGNDQLYVPSYHELVKWKRRKLVYQEHLEGLSHKQIAKKYQVSVRTVYSIIAEHRNEHQADCG